MESKKLADLLERANTELEGLRRHRDLRRRRLHNELVAPLEAQITQLKRNIDRDVEEAFPFSDFDAIKSRIAELNRKLNEAKVAEAKSSRPLIGNTVQYWQRRRYGEGGYVKGDIGVVDVYDGTNIGRKNGSYRMPAVGELFIRNIKKDGKPGMNTLARVPADGLPGGWYQLGVDPNEELLK